MNPGPQNEGTYLHGCGLATAGSSIHLRGPVGQGLKERKRKDVPHTVNAPVWHVLELHLPEKCRVLLVRDEPGEYMQISVAGHRE